MNVAMKRALFLVSAILLVAFASAFLVLRSEWFATVLRERVIAEVARMLGASAVIGELTVDWRTLTFRAAPVVVRGTEPAGAPPLLQAKSMEIGLNVRSFLRPSVDVRSLIIDQPRVNIIVNEDGSTNIPGHARDKPLAAALIDLSVGRFELRNGEASIGLRRVPLDVRAEGVHAVVDFDAPGQGYRGTASARSIAIAPVTVSMESRFELRAARLDVVEIRAATEHSSIAGSGFLEDWRSPRGEWKLQIRADVDEAVRLAKVAGVRGGEITGDVSVKLADGRWSAEGPLAAQGITGTIADQTLRNLSGRARVSVDQDTAQLDAIEVFLLGGTFRGVATVRASGAYRAAGSLESVSAPHSVSTSARGPIEISGTARGVDSMRTRLELTPRQGAVPVGGTVDISYDGALNELTLQPSSLTLGESRVNAAGTLARGLRFQVRTRNLNELLPALSLVVSDVPGQLPVALDGGLATLTGVASGPLDKPSARGTMVAEKVRYESQTLEGVSGTFDLNPSSAAVSIQGRQGTMEIAGRVTAVLQNWRLNDSDAISGDATVRNASAERFGLPVKGTVSAAAAIGGTLGRPTASGTASLLQGSVYDEPFDAINAQFRWRRDLLEILKGEVLHKQNRAAFSGTFRPASPDWRAGDVTFAVETPGWHISRFRHAGDASGAISGSARVTGETLQLISLNGSARLVSPQIGEAQLDAATAGGLVRVNAKASAHGARLNVESSWSPVGNVPGTGSVRLSGLTTATMQSLLSADGTYTELPFDGLIEGSGEFFGPLADPERLAGRFRLSTLRFAPKPGTLPAGISAQDLTVHNDGDIVFSASPRGLAIQQAKFIAKDTEIDAIGNVGFLRTNAWNLLLRGRANLAVLSAFKPDLVSSGVSTVNARLRGTLADPQVDGRMELRDASFFLSGVPNGLDKVNGTILFDRQRATIESLRAESGGGALLLGGFIGFGRELTYQVRAQVDRVRVRYPEGVSTQASAALTLTGGSRRSILGGDVTILRAALNPSTDVGNLIAVPTRPITLTGAGNEFLRNLQFDVHIETSLSAEFSTELTRDVQADVDLRLRGTPARPVLLGRVSITQGQIQFFGTDYRINRGDVTFVNAARVEPQVELDLETRLRGILVSINFAGPLNKMNMSYRSDPPLQSSEILALLAVGRAPTSVTAAAGGAIRGQDLLAGDGSALLDSAISSPQSGRLQRFFGITRLKIDPQLIGLDNTPQARISIEQPISRNVAITYVTSVNRAQQQWVRLEWDFSRAWSAIATRDENGVFSVDFIFKRSFR